MASTKNMDDTRSEISEATSSVFGGTNAPHLQDLREARNVCKAALTAFTLNYAAYAERDPQEWEDLDADLDIFDEVLELDSRAVTICMAFRKWVARCTLYLDPQNQTDIRFIRNVNQFIEKVKGKFFTRPFLLKCNRDNQAMVDDRELPGLYITSSGQFAFKDYWQRLINDSLKDVQAYENSQLRKTNGQQQSPNQTPTATKPKPNPTATRGPEERWIGVDWEKELLEEKKKAKISGLRRK